MRFSELFMLKLEQFGFEACNFLSETLYDIILILHLLLCYTLLPIEIMFQIIDFGVEILFLTL